MPGDPLAYLRGPLFPHLELCEESCLSTTAFDLQQPLTVHCHSVQHTQGTTSTPSHSSVANETTEAEEQRQGDRTGPDGIEPAGKSTGLLHGRFRENMEGREAKQVLKPHIGWRLPCPLAACQPTVNHSCWPKVRGPS